jgi:chemotaxis protein methyltransferase CheR
MTVLLPEADLAALSAFVAERMGLHFPRERWPELGAGLEAARQEFGFADASECARWMMSAPLDLGQITVLASSLTIGETYFFRHRELFALLEDQILPALIAGRRGNVQRLRLWSAGCCTGEEAYTLAILVRRLIPDPARWNITILASDINPGFLRKARAGVYREWSFRNAPDWLKGGYFTRTESGDYSLLPEIAGMVTFFPLNLVEDTYPSLFNDTNAMDVILCRNVLMYFAPDQAQRVAGKLAQALVAGGWLAVSPCETSCFAQPALTPAGGSGLALYQKGMSDLPGREAGTDSGLASSAGSAGGEGGVRPTFPSENEYALRARALANQGRMEEALTWCDQALASNPLDAACHYLRAGILSELGNVTEAVRAFHRSVTIAPDFVLAHFAMGNAIRQRKGKDARRHYENALRLLEPCAPEEIVPHSEGLTAGRLRDTITSLIEVETVHEQRTRS